MTLRDIIAAFDCDGCGERFSVPLDPVYEPPATWSIFDVAVDAVRGSVGYRGPRSLNGTEGISSVDKSGRHLCGECTDKRDRESNE